MNEIIQEIQHHRIVPVVAIAHQKHAAGLANALISGGLPIAEITLRTPCALAVIRELSNFGGFLIGAGTVLNREQCEQAIAAGASFIVSPGLDDGIVKCCTKHKVPCFPGAATATEIQRAFNSGLRIVKFFPAETSGGIAALKALAGPFHEMQFLPTGGITPSNAAAYLELPSTIAVGCSWMVKPELYATGDFAEVQSRTQQIVSQFGSKD